MKPERTIHTRGTTYGCFLRLLLTQRVEAGLQMPNFHRLRKQSGKDRLQAGAQTVSLPPKCCSSDLNKQPLNYYKANYPIHEDFQASPNPKYWIFEIGDEYVLNLEINTQGLNEDSVIIRVDIGPVAD